MLLPRILTALVLLPLMLGMLFFANAPVWAVFSGLIALLALWEYARLAQMPKPMWVTYVAMTAATGYLVYQFNYKLSIIEHGIVLLFWCVLVPCWLKYKWKLHSGFMAILLGWILLFPFWLALVQLRNTADYQTGARSLLAIMALVWVADIGAYVFGRLFGRHKLAVTISPGKTWEGATGGLVCVLIYTFVIKYLGWWAFELPDFYGLPWLLFALIFTALSIEGDLLESWFKRAAGIKDSSNLLPGHGGVYDRIDAMVSVLGVYTALSAFYLYWLYG